MSPEAVGIAIRSCTHPFLKQAWRKVPWTYLSNPVFHPPSPHSLFVLPGDPPWENHRIPGRGSIRCNGGVCISLTLSDVLAFGICCFRGLVALVSFLV